jgi:2,3-dihydroxybenzoate decarboxylase
MAGNGRDRITRRGFLEAGSAALVGTTLLADTKKAGAAENAGAEKVNAGAENGKIALEEHFAVPELFDSSLAMNKDLALPRIRERILDAGSGRIAEMDRGEVELAILSFVAPGIQAIPDAAQAITTARRTNDYLAEQVAKNPKRLKGFAALPLQDPQAAAQELTRCVKELGLCGALVNGFSQIDEVDSAVYYDLPQYRPFWATVQELDVPFYLHPRAPLPSRRQAYEGHPWMVGSAWGFAAETSIHALRLMGSGLFDEYPRLKIILGHLGEGIPFNIWRVDHRVQLNSAKPKAKLPIGQYLRENFYITTSGNFHSETLADVIAEVGLDRVMYSADYPFEDMVEAKDWFDETALSAPDRARIARGNAEKLFRL